MPPSALHVGCLLFFVAAIVVGSTVAGPGLTWDEPAYRGSQVRLQEWLRELWTTRDLSLLGAEEIKHYWEFNRFGPNFHPPMASYLNLLTFGALGGFMDDVCARRMASALQFAGLVGILGWFVGRCYGIAAGAFAGLSLLFMPRLVGDAHLIGTDITLLFFWTTTAIAFYLGAESPRWQWVCAASAACLFLTKFSGVVLIAPLAVWFLGTLWTHRRFVGVWLWRTFALLWPLLPLAAVALFGAKYQSQRGVVGDAVRWAYAYPFLLTATLFVPAMLFAWRQSRPKPDGWPVALEIPWRIAVLAPPLAVMLNPTWWHNAPEGLAAFVDLNLNRQGKLPDIGIFYMGQRFGYSLPWHNGFVLLAVTVPVGVLLLGLLGAFRAVSEVRRDRLPVYLLLQALALVAFRMFNTPGHDGVRLFLPTFLFWAGLAGLGARWLARGRHTMWIALFAAGPGWSACEWLRTHPYELSYYNIGLANAVDAGFESTYWYDAVTPAVLADLNAGPDRLPENAAVVTGLDPLINPETFFMLQALGKLRGDLRLNEPRETPNKWAWLLTHSSKASPLTRLLYACEPHYEHRWAGARLFSVYKPRSLNTALALLALTVDSGQISRDVGGTTKLEPLVLAEEAFRASPEELAAALTAWRNPNDPLPPGRAGALVSRWRERAFPAMYLPLVEQEDPGALDAAVRILQTRTTDVRRVLEYPGYLREPKFNGCWKAD